MASSNLWSKLFLSLPLFPDRFFGDLRLGERVFFGDLLNNQRFRFLSFDLASAISSSVSSINYATGLS